MGATSCMPCAGCDIEQNLCIWFMICVAFHSDICQYYECQRIDRDHPFMQGVLAYVFVRPSLAAIQLICMFIDANGWGEDTWGEGKFKLNKWWLWCQMINNVTQVRFGSD